MEAKQLVYKFTLYVQSLPLWFDKEANLYRNLFGNQALTFDELYEDFLTTLKTTNENY